MALTNGQQEHPHDGKEKGCDGEEETALSHMSLAEFCGGAGEKQDGGEQDGVAQILSPNITGPFLPPLATDRRWDSRFYLG